MSVKEIPYDAIEETDGRLVTHLNGARDWPDVIFVRVPNTPGIFFKRDRPLPEFGFAYINSTSGMEIHVI